MDSHGILVADLRQMSASGTVSPVPAVPAFIPSARSSPRSAVAAAQAVAGTPGPGAPSGPGGNGTDCFFWGIYDIYMYIYVFISI